MPVPHHSCPSAVLATLLTGSVLACPAPVNAMQQDLFELSLEELGNVTITGATLTQKSVRDVPASVTVFTRADLQTLAVNSLEDLMNRVPGMQSFHSSDRGIAQPSSIRGRRVAASNREILVLVNGMKIDGYYSGGINSTLPLLPLANIARVEFIRGPGSAVYGSNAYTGVINIITVDDVNQAAISAGDHGHLEGRIQHAYVDDQLRSSLMLNGRDDKGEDFEVQDTLSSARTRTDDPYSSAYLQWQLDIGADTQVQFIGARSASPRYYVLGNINNRLNAFDSDFAGLMLTQALHWHDAISSQLSGGWKYSNLAPQGSAAALPGSDTVNVKADIRSTEYWLNWQNDWQLGDRDSLQFGGEYRHPQITRADGFSNYDLAELANGNFPLTDYGAFGYTYQVMEKTHMDVIGIHGQWQMDWSKYWSTVAGLRYDNYSQIGDHVSPRLGLLFHADDHNTLKLLSGEAFRAPQAGELYTSNNPVIRGNPDLKPETVVTSELIWLHQRQGGQFSLIYFYNEFDNAIDQAIVNGLRIYANSDQQETSDGVEAELQAEIAPGFKLLATGTWLMTTPATFFREARDLYSLSGLYNHNDFYGSISAYYRSDRQTLVDNGARKQTLDSYIVVDLKTGYRWAPDWRTEVEILNLLNERYYTPTQSSRIEDGVPNRTRELRLGFVWDY